MTVAENLGIGRLIGGSKGRKLEELVYERFPVLKERRHQAAGTLSGGQQQQLAIGRALIGNPSLMLLDEPSEGIQPSIVEMISAAVRAIRNELGTTILFVEQNLEMILAMSDRCYVLDKGRIVAEVSKEQLSDADAVRRHLLI
jgi:branched-chain amino acid transport system ATP-binding protein